MAFRLIREKKEARRNAKLAEIFMVRWWRKDILMFIAVLPTGVWGKYL